MFLSIVSCCEGLNFKIRGKFIESDIVFQSASINIHATIGVNGLVFMQGRTLWDSLMSYGVFIASNGNASKTSFNNVHNDFPISNSLLLKQGSSSCKTNTSI